MNAMNTMLADILKKAIGEENLAKIEDFITNAFDMIKGVRDDIQIIKDDVALIKAAVIVRDPAEVIMHAHLSDPEYMRAALEYEEGLKADVNNHN